MGSYVISDIHGCYDELIRMLEKINLEDSDTLICAGDYVDKGPKNAEVLEWIMNVPPNVILLRGNHDEDFAQNIEAMRINQLQNGCLTGIACRTRKLCTGR